MTTHDIGTIVSPGVILDRQTQDELQLPCEVATDLNPECGKPADIIFRTACPRCSAATVLLVCAPHLPLCVASALARGACLACTRISRNWAWTTENLR